MSCRDAVTAPDGPSSTSGRARLDGDRLKSIVENTDDVVFALDATGRWSFLNPNWTSVTGFAIDPCVGRSYAEFVHPDDSAASMQRFKGLLATGRDYGTHAVRYATQDGSWRWLEARMRRMLDQSGQPVGAAGVLRDVTTRTALAGELSRAHEQAMRSVAQVSEFLANVSHEIRTPLNGVMGLVTLLLDTELNDEQRHLTVTAQQSAETLLNLVNDIIDISKIESGNLTIERVPIDVVSWAERVTGPAFSKARVKGLDARLRIDDALPAAVVGDPTRCQQILANLLDNAVKFTQSGSVTVDLGVVMGPDGRRMLRTAVTDCGIGIPPEKQAVVFEKYRQADSSTTRRYGGTGLGLAICRQLAAWMDGDVGLESEVGRGSTFWFTIPLVVAEVERAAATTDMDAADLGSWTPRVLLVEDNATNQFVAKRFLEKMHCVVEIADNGAVAVERVRQDVFDVVFMDCQMPVMDGYEATRQIRLLPGRARTPIVAMTANAMTGDREKCLAAGMTDYVSKPLRRDAVRTVLGRLRESDRDRGMVESEALTV